MKKKEKRPELDKTLLIDGVNRAENCCIVANDNCLAIQGNKDEILSLISSIVSQVKDDIPEDAMMRAIKVGYMSEKEKLDMLVKIFKEKFGGEE